MLGPEGPMLGPEGPMLGPKEPPEKAQALLGNYLKRLGVTPMEAAIAGGALGTVGIAGLGGADPVDAIGASALGAGVAAAPEIFNAVRQKSFRHTPRGRRELIQLILGGAGVGAGTSFLTDAFEG